MVAILTRSAETGRENAALKRAFQAMGLDPTPVTDTPEDAEAENGHLRALLKWAYAYRMCPDRKKLESRGFMFPPVEPDCDPDTDWLRFERWMRGKPTEWRYADDFGPLKQAAALSDSEIEKALKTVVKNLAKRNMLVEFQPGIPARLVYSYLRDELDRQSFEFLAPGTTCHLDGCHGSCPDCFQRPWCDLAGEMQETAGQ